jgi:hypothetical protein
VILFSILGEIQQFRKNMVSIRKKKRKWIEEAGEGQAEWGAEGEGQRAEGRGQDGGGRRRRRKAESGGGGGGRRAEGGGRRAEGRGGWREEGTKLNFFSRMHPYPGSPSSRWR